MKSILDKSFRYTPSYETDISKTFAKVKKLSAKNGQLDNQPIAKQPIGQTPLPERPPECLDFTYLG